MWHSDEFWHLTDWVGHVQPVAALGRSLGKCESPSWRSHIQAVETMGLGLLTQCFVVYDFCGCVLVCCASYCQLLDSPMFFCWSLGFRSKRFFIIQPGLILLLGCPDSRGREISFAGLLYPLSIFELVTPVCHVRMCHAYAYAVPLHQQCHDSTDFNFNYTLHLISQNEGNPRLRVPR